MKKSMKKGLSALALAVAAVAVALLAQTYFRFVSRKIYEENSSLLSEVYTQVNRNLFDFMDRSWGNLRDWSAYLREGDEQSIGAYLEGCQNYWRFSCFYFLSADGSYLTPQGEEGHMELGMEGVRLFDEREQIMMSNVTPDGRTVTLFALPTADGEYKGFSYCAIGVSYTNSDIVAALSVHAFSGQSRCFVLRGDGSVLLSTQTGGSVFSNYFTYLRAGSDLGEEDLALMQKIWQDKEGGVLLPTIGGERYYLVYLAVGYEDLVLLGMVPEAEASTAFQEIQRATLNAMFGIFGIVSLVIAFLIMYRYKKANEKSALELKYRDLMFDALSQSVDEIFLMVDRGSWRVDYVSPNIERLLGISIAQARENVRNLWDCVVDSDGTFSRETLGALALHSSCQQEFQCIRRGSKERLWYRVSIYREKIEDTEKYIIVMFDRTQEKFLMQSLETALEVAKNANKAKSDFLSNMSHDIRTPMNAIIGFNVLLAKYTDDPERVREYTRKISLASQHLLYLINDILDMSKIESGKASLNIAEFHLPQLVEELYSMLLPQAKAKQQCFETHVQGHPAERLLGDRLKLNQILINLLSNALKYTPKGGVIDFQVIDLPQLSPQFARVRFVVSDNGIGMSEEFLTRIFDTFSREETSTVSGIQGTGLGMAITKSLVDLMGGTIDAQSVQGQGSAFTVDFSFSIPDAKEDEQFWLHHHIGRILVVDDEEDICLGIKEIMEETGVGVRYATSGPQALAIAEESVRNAEEFQVVLLDWKMPGWSGIETSKRLREQLGEDVPMLILTAYDWSDIEDEARGAGITAFMPKPFFVSTFRQTLERIHMNHADEEDPEVRKDEQVSLEGLKFLVVEDNEINAEILGELLDMEGARYTLAGDGREALDRFLASKEGDYDMILMDIQMPVMNGYEATRAIRASGHPMAGKIPIIAMTANAFAEDVRSAMEAGMNGHLAKPVNLDAMISLISRVYKESVEKKS